MCVWIMSYLHYEAFIFVFTQYICEVDICCELPYRYPQIILQRIWSKLVIIPRYYYGYAKLGVSMQDYFVGNPYHPLQEDLYLPNCH